MRYTMPAVILGWLTACGGGGTTASTSGEVTSADTVILCSATTGPIAGKPGQSLDAGDAGDLQECQPGGQCEYMTSPPPGGQAACDSSTPPSDGGVGLVNCPQAPFVPYWGCVYVGGGSGDGGTVHP